MEKKVYCKDCKYKKYDNSVVTHYCLHINNRVDTWNEQELGLCEVSNATNQCLFFEPKEVKK